RRHHVRPRTDRDQPPHHPRHHQEDVHLPVMKPPEPQRHQPAGRPRHQRLHRDPAHPALAMHDPPPHQVPHPPPPPPHPTPRPPPPPPPPPRVPTPPSPQPAPAPPPSRS